MRKEEKRERKKSVKNIVLTGVVVDMVGVSSCGGELLLRACGMVTKTDGGSQDGSYCFRFVVSVVRGWGRGKRE